MLRQSINTKLNSGLELETREESASLDDSLGRDETQLNWGRLLVEGILYLALVCRVFGNQLGVLSFTGLSGAIIISGGLFCLVVMISQREPLPGSLLFAFIINIIANLTDLFHIGLFTREMVYWMCALLMAVYVVRDQRSALRFEYFLALILLLSVAIGAVFVGDVQGLKRMALVSSEVGSMFANSNDLAQFACMTAVALLFSSFKFKAFTKLLCWGVAFALSAVVLLTLSRQGLFLLLGGAFFYFLATTKGRGGKIGPIVLVILALVASVIFADDVATIVSGYEYRLGLSSERVAYWKTAPQDMMDTLISGSGTYKGFSSGGIKPHNTFLWLHLAYGGICAWTYFAWLVWLTVKSFQIALDRETEWQVRMEVLAVLSLFVMAQGITVFAPSNYGYILGVALLERRFLPTKREKAALAGAS